MKLRILIITLFLQLTAWAQSPKIIKGTIVDGSLNNTPLAYATIVIKGTQTGASSDENGLFEFECPDGIHTLEASYMGYKTQEFQVDTNQLNDLSIVLVAEEDTMEDLVITVSQNKQNEAVLLGEQRKSLEIKQQIGAQELSRKGVGDVATAVTKTTGVNKQESTGGIFVRGLGDRYNSTTLNGLPLVSNDPENKNIRLDIFSTDIVEFISIDKTYLARNYGDFGGANIDIVSKKHTGNGTFNIQIGANANTNAIGQKDFQLQSGRGVLGFSNNKSIPDNALNNYGFKTPFNTSTANVPYGGNFGFNGGKTFFVGDQGKLSIFGTASFTNDYEYREGINKTLSAEGARRKDLFQKTYGYNTNTTGMFNVNYDLNSSNNIAYNFLFVNSSSLRSDDYRGYLVDQAEGPNGGIINRNTYVENRLMTHQLLGNHQLGEQTTLNWGASYNKVTSDLPDRTQTTMRWNDNAGGYTLVGQTNSDNHRYFHFLDEKEIIANASVEHKIGKREDGTFRGKIVAGYNGRFKKRNFEATQFNLRIDYAEREIARDPSNLDAFFNQENLAAGKFEILTFRGNVPNALEPQFYNGDLKIHAGYANFEFQFSEKLYGLFGVRYEKIRQLVDWKTQMDNSGLEDLYEKNAFLPSLNLKYELNGTQNLRLSASKTYTLPQFKERVPFIYEKVDESSFGNKDLYASDNYNLDIKWEYFPQNDEILSATLFGKYIKNPINTTNVASSTNDITYVNTGDYGYVAGIEIEVRKNLFYFSDDNSHKLSAGLNFAYMKTEQELNEEKVRAENNFSSNFTYDKAGFTGASEFLGNVDLTYYKSWKDKNVLATLAYNYNSDRIYALGVEGKGNLVDKGFGTLDFIFKTKLNQHFGLGFTAKNILNPSIERMQENITENLLVRSYKLGMNLGVSLNYSF